MKTLFCIFIGGGLGSILRFLVSKWSVNYLHESLPFGTIIANILASLLLGYITAKTLDADQLWGSLIAIGFCGGFSTYSTFSSETFRMLQHGDYAIAFLNILLNLFLCLAAIWLGMTLAK